MSISTAGQVVLDHEYLPVRAKIIEIAASLDRIERAEGRADDQADDDPRWGQLHDALDILQSRVSNRAERIQLLFSSPYDSTWRQTLGT